MNEEGNFDEFKPMGEIKPLPQPSIEQYEQKANPMLEEHGRQIVKKSQYELMKWAVIILGILAVGFIYLAFTDGFKANVNTTCPTITIPSCPICEASNFSCPENNCNATCVFPSNLTIRMINST